jgi:hypothetical protein
VERRRIIVGIDASPLRIGYAITLDDHLVEYDTIRIPRDAALARRRDAWLGLRDTIRRIEDAEKADTNLIGIEAPYIGPNRQGSLNHARQIGHQEAFALISFPYAEQRLIQPQTWRSIIGIARRGKTAPYEYALGLVDDDAGIDQDTADAICIVTALRLQDSS